MNKGILILFLSPFRRRGLQEYGVENSEKIFYGEETNDVPIKYLLHYAATENDKNVITKIMCIASRKVREIHENGKSDVDCFKDTVRSYIQSDQKLFEYYRSAEEQMPQIVTIDYDEEEERQGTSGRSLKVYKQIVKNLEDESEFYIDYTGGFRDISFLMTTIVRYLEYQGMSCRKIVYSNGQTRMIQSIDCIYDMFRLINGVDQFVRTGNAALLKECYEQEEDSETTELLDLIVQFSEVISLCNVKEMDALLPKISDALNSYGGEEKESSFFIEMFNSMIDIIRRKLYLSEGNMLTYQQLIHWCLDNDMVQQALTLYIEKMPKYYYESGFLQIPDNVSKYMMGGSTKETAAFYGFLYDFYLKDEALEEFLNILSEINTEEKEYRWNKISELKKKSRRAEVKTALNRLAEFLRKYYDQDGNRKKDLPDIYGKSQKEKSGWKFVNSVKYNGYLQHYFMYDDKVKYDQTKLGTYQKKILALDRIREFGKVPEGTSIKASTLYEMMKYYCALKLLRNRINHASEKDVTEDESKAMEALRKKHGIDISVDFKRIKEILGQGIEAHLDKKQMENLKGR